MNTEKYVNEWNGMKMEVHETSSSGNWLAIKFIDLFAKDKGEQYAVVNRKHPEPLCFCPSWEKAGAIACAMHMGETVVEQVSDVAKKEKEKIDAKVAKFYDRKAMESKMDELIKAGKNHEEILKYMTEHRTDYLLDKSVDPMKDDDTKTERKDW